MFYWSIILFACIAAGVILAIITRKTWDNLGIFIGALACFTAAIVIALSMLDVYCDYQEFTASFENQKKVINSQIDKSSQYTVDVFNANSRLFKIQHSKEKWGNWSMYPDSVMNITPIGLEN